MKWIDNARLWHRLWSMRLMIATTTYSAAAGAWAVLPPDWKPDLSETAKAILAGIGVLLPAAGAVAVLVKQESLAAAKRPDAAPTDVPPHD